MTDTDIAPIDAQTALDLLAAAVELTGADHVAPKFGANEYGSGGACKYEDEGNPSCLVGVALAIHGVPIDTLADWDTAAKTIDNIQVGGYAPFLDAHAAAVLAAAQTEQDSGNTWGDAYDTAASMLGFVAGEANAS